MPLVSKSELADTLRVSRARVSQFLKMGLPVRADGLLDLTEALHWVARNVEPDANCGGAGVVASNLLRERTPKPTSGKSQMEGRPPIPPGFDIIEQISNPADGMMVMGLLLMLHRVGWLASIAAHDAGADRKVAERTGQVLTALFVQAATDMLVDCGVEPIASNPDAMLWPHPRFFDKVNWEALGPPGEFARQSQEASGAS